MIDYIFTISVGAFTQRTVHPIYGSGVKVETSRASDEQYFRRSWSGNLTFVGEDYDWIMAQPFTSVYTLTVGMVENGQPVGTVFSGEFRRTDCRINLDDRTIVVQPSVADAYTAVLAGMETEYNLLDLAISSNPVNVKKRPCVQVYTWGSEYIATYNNGIFWEDTAAHVVDSGIDIFSTYRFGLCNVAVQLTIPDTYNGKSQAPYAGTYSGTLTQASTSSTSITMRGTLLSRTNTSYYITWELTYSRANGSISSETIRLYSGTIVAGFTTYGSGAAPDAARGVLLAGTANVYAEWQRTRIYGRILCDVPSIQGTATYPLPSDDISGDNRNYTRVLPLAYDVATMSDIMSSEPTPYGRGDNEQYYTAPTGGYKYQPIAKDEWGAYSIWFYAPSALMSYIAGADKSFAVRDCYSVGGVISALLKEVGAGITFEETAAYSEFLYGDVTVVAGTSSRWVLFMTPITNLLAGEGAESATRATVTLRQVLDMLRDVLNCYWFIDGTRLRIEHLKYFENGQSYGTVTRSISYDLTTMFNTRNGKSWAFATSEYTFDKQAMPERIVREWANEVSDAFAGSPIVMLSPFVDVGNTESISVAGFTSDVDYMLLHPDKMDKDGFALLAPVDEALAIMPPGTYSGSPLTGQSGNGTTPYAVPASLRGRTVVLRGATAILNPANAVYLNAYDDATLSSYENIATFSRDTGGTYNFDMMVEIPADAQYIRFVSVSSVYVSITRFAPASDFNLPLLNIAGASVQNAFLSFYWLANFYLRYGLPCDTVQINGATTFAASVARNKVQSVAFPIGSEAVDEKKLIKTSIGEGIVEKISISLSSRIATTELRHVTDSE